MFLSNKNNIKKVILFPVIKLTDDLMPIVDSNRQIVEDTQKAQEAAKKESVEVVEKDA